jgi:hypothetical protein
MAALAMQGGALPGARAQALRVLKSTEHASGQRSGVHCDVP